MQPLKPDYRTLARLAIYIAMLLVVGAILAPPVFFAAQSYIKANLDNAVSRTLASKELPSYFSRCAMLAAFLGLVPLLRSLRLPWSAIAGAQPWRAGSRQMAAGFFAAVIGIVIMGFVCWAGGACKLKSNPG